MYLIYLFDDLFHWKSERNFNILITNCFFWISNKIEAKKQIRFAKLDTWCKVHLHKNRKEIFFQNKKQNRKLCWRLFKYLKNLFFYVSFHFTFETRGFCFKKSMRCRSTEATTCSISILIWSLQEWWQTKDPFSKCPSRKPPSKNW